MSELASFFSEAFAGQNRVCILGVGTELCHDDAAGLFCIDQLSARLGIPVGEATGRLLLVLGGPAPENFSGLIREFHPDLLVVVDAAFLELPAGSIQLLPEERAAGLSFSTHMLPLPMLISYLKLACNCQTCLVGIQPATTEQGIGMSARAQEGAALLAEILSHALNEENV
ncbi:MAG: hydrogenase maturation protease [Eubacteriales bacterium]|nr:hydrogenase maturation protease [Eubacteriales bacterium]